jgi:predicted DNA-binding transcriptional regulator YafY
MQYGLKDRVLRVLMTILKEPFVYTKRALAELYGTTVQSIEDDFAVMKNAGFVLDHDDEYRYKLVENQPNKQLKHLLHFSEEEQLMLEEAIDTIGEQYDNKAQELKKKLNALYDFGRLGHSYLRKPYLSKLDLLEEAAREEKQVYLRSYRSSNSNLVKDRLVEAFYFNAADDLIQAFDLEQKALRHFRISRVGKIEVLDQSWQFKTEHRLLKIDPFRVVNDDQELVHIQLKVGAYNELVERFPLTKNSIEYLEKEDIYEFKAMVNANFYGLMNFILGNFHQMVEVLAPEGLKTQLRTAIEAMQKSMKS